MTTGPDTSGKLSRPSNVRPGGQQTPRASAKSTGPEMADFRQLMEELRSNFGDDPDTLRDIITFLSAMVRNRKPTLIRDQITVNGDIGEHVLVGSGSMTVHDNRKTTIIQSSADEKLLDDLERSYFESLVNRVNNNLLSQLVIKSVSSQFMPEIELERLYVPLDCTEAAKTLKDSEQKIQQEPVLNVINRREKANFVLLGDPGSGKSTFINYLTLALANALLKPGEDEVYYKKLDTPEKGSHRAYRWDRSKVWKPLRIELSDLADSISSDVKEGEARLVNEYLKRHLASLGKERLITRFESYLAKGECLVLFDGLDEVYSAVASDKPANGKSRIIRQCIERFVKANPSNRFIVTCRVLSYLNEDVKLEKGLFEELRLAPLAEESIEYFINNWYTAISNEKKSISNTEAFARVRSLKKSCTRDLYDIAKNPMLLTVMAIIHTYSRTLPKHKVQLYKECIDLLLFQWNQSKISENHEGEFRICDLLDVPYNQLMSGLCKVAYMVQDAQSRRTNVICIPRSTLVKVFATFMGGTEQEAKNKAEEISSYIEIRAGLLVGKGKDTKGELVYSFAHRGFQEYLAALHVLNERSVARKIHELCVVGGFWYEVVMLAIGELVYASPINTSEVMDIIFALVPQTPDPTKPEDWRKIWWGGEMLNMVGLPLAENDMRKDMIPLLRRLMTELVTTDKLSPIERARTADVLSLLGDSRSGVINPILDAARDMILFTGQTANVGSAPMKVNPFYVARYPVTNAQFRVFAREMIKGASNYNVREFWTEAGKKWVSSVKGMGGYIHDPSWGADNRPVCGVTWYEAQAYARWLSHKTGEKYRLLTEAEWESVASGGKGRAFPWGDRIPANQSVVSNTQESLIGETCSVGIFKGDRTEEGVYDLGGNVFEWTSSLAKPLPYRASDGREELEGDGERVLRGGCYALERGAASHSTDRQSRKPDSQSPQIGFRVAKDASK